MARRGKAKQPKTTQRFEEEGDPSMNAIKTWKDIGGDSEDDCRFSSLQ
jgi:hypothetical protein